MSAYFVTVERRGVSPLKLRLLVRAESKESAAGLAAVTAERERGGTFETARIRSAGRRRGLEFDAAA